MQFDEIWSFVYAKNDNVRTAKNAPVNAGDTWTWVAICADTKLLISTLVGQRNTDYALRSMPKSRARQMFGIPSGGLARRIGGGQGVAPRARDLTSVSAIAAAVINRAAPD